MAEFTEADYPRQLEKGTKEDRFKTCQKETLYQWVEIQVPCKENVNKAEVCKYCGQMKC